MSGPGALEQLFYDGGWRPKSKEQSLSEDDPAVSYEEHVTVQGRNYSRKGNGGGWREEDGCGVPTGRTVSNQEVQDHLAQSASTRGLSSRNAPFMDGTGRVERSDSSSEIGLVRRTEGLRTSYTGNGQRVTETGTGRRTDETQLNREVPDTPGIRRPSRIHSGTPGSGPSRTVAASLPGRVRTTDGGKATDLFGGRVPVESGRRRGK